MPISYNALTMKKISLIVICLVFISSVAFAFNSDEATKNLSENHVSKVEEIALYEEKYYLGMEKPFSAIQTEINEENNRDSYFVEVIFWGINSNPKVNHFLNYYRDRAKERFNIWLSRAGKYLPLINRIFIENGLAEELVFLPLIESGFSPYATSRAQAVGIWQFMKGTAKKYGLRVDKFVDERRDPEMSTIAAANYLKDLYEMFGSWDFALAAYNAGEGKIKRIKNSTGYKSFWDVISHKKIKRETKEYVPRFVAATIIAKKPEDFGFENIEYNTLIEDTEKVLLPPKTTLKSIAEAISVDEETIKELNPAIKNGFLPPDTSYYVRVPRDKAEELIARIDELKKADEKSIKKAALKKDSSSKRLSKKSRKTNKKIADAKPKHLS